MNKKKKRKAKGRLLRSKQVFSKDDLPLENKHIKRNFGILWNLLEVPQKERTPFESCTCNMVLDWMLPWSYSRGLTSGDIHFCSVHSHQLKDPVSAGLSSHPWSLHFWIIIFQTRNWIPIQDLTRSIFNIFLYLFEAYTPWQQKC